VLHAFCIAWAGSYLKQKSKCVFVLWTSHHPLPTPSRALRRTCARLATEIATLSLHGITPTHSVSSACQGLPRTRLCCCWPIFLPTTAEDSLSQSTSRHRVLAHPLLSPPFFRFQKMVLESHSSFIPTAAHDISFVRGYLCMHLCTHRIAAPSATRMTHLSVGSRLYLKQAIHRQWYFCFPLSTAAVGSPIPVQSLRACRGTRVRTLGSNPADCPISCLFYPPQAHSDFTPSFRKGRLVTQEL
jgi:hypothetical protein